MIYIHFPIWNKFKCVLIVTTVEEILNMFMTQERVFNLGFTDKELQT